MSTADQPLEIIPLGGLGEFGMNMMVYRYGRDCLVVDAGMMFPGDEHLGVDVVVPDLTFLEDCGTIHAVLLTHGHEDHIGALPHLLQRHDLPVYAAPFTEALARRRLLDRSDGETDATFRPLPSDGERLELGPFVVESLAAAHSIPQARMLVLRTPVGTVVHTADFKLDPDPLDGLGTDLARLAALGTEGVLALLSDSTNADCAGWTPGERQVVDGIRPIVRGSGGRVVVTTFASHVQRVHHLAGIARETGRKLAVVGASLEHHVDAAERLGILSIEPSLRVAPDEIMNVEPAQLLALVSGSQGEPGSAMARVAVGRHPDLTLQTDDLVIHAARRIPGNEKSIGRLIDHVMRRGAEVITAADAPVHVSGHASADELRLLVRLLRPRCVVPIHGEYRQLRALARIATDCGVDPDRVTLAESGDVVSLTEEAIGVVDRVLVGQVFVDASRDRVDWSVLRDRQRIAGDGVVIPIVALHRDSGPRTDFLKIVTSGFVPASVDGAPLVAEARKVVTSTLNDATPEERRDEGLLKERIRTELRRFLRKQGRRRPLVIPVILEL